MKSINVKYGEMAGKGYKLACLQAGQPIIVVKYGFILPHDIPKKQNARRTQKEIY